MIHALLDLSIYKIFAVLLALYAATGLLLFWLTFLSPARTAVGSCAGIVAPYFGAIALLFALLTGFLTADIGERNRRATQAVQSEAEALTSLYALSIASVTDMAPIRGAIRAYARSALEDEWDVIADGKSATKTADLLTALMEVVAKPEIARDAGQAVHTALVNLSLRVAGARAERLAIGADRTNELKWATVLFLCFMTQVSIGMVHLERRRAFGAALTIFSIAAVVALTLIAEQESPFAGEVQVSRAPLQNVLKLPPAPNNPNG